MDQNDAKEEGLFRALTPSTISVSIALAYGLRLMPIIWTAGPNSRRGLRPGKTDEFLQSERTARTRIQGQSVREQVINLLRT